MDHKTFDLIEVKADSESGSFTALASVFGNVDKGGDRVMPGAFTRTLERWRESGRPIPIILSHQWDDLKAWIGKADPRAVMETEDGLLVQGQIDMEDPDARKAHKLMKDGLLTGWSFGYAVAPGGSRRAKDDARELTDLDLFEAGPTLVGMNPEAQLQAVKSLAAEHDIDPDQAEADAKAVIAYQTDTPETIDGEPPNDVTEPLMAGKVTEIDGGTATIDLNAGTKDAGQIIGDLVASCRAFLRDYPDDGRADLISGMLDRLQSAGDGMAAPNLPDDNQKTDQGRDGEDRHGDKSQTSDLAEYWELFATVTDGIPEIEPPRKKAPPKEQPSMDELERQFHRTTFEILTGKDQTA